MTKQFLAIALAVIGLMLIALLDGKVWSDLANTQDWLDGKDAKPKG